MSHYDIIYKTIDDRVERDAKAIQDIRDWMGDEKFESFVKNIVRKRPIDYVNFALAFAGVTGYPFHALCRAERLADYREWMASEPDPVPTDEEGYEID